MFFLEAPASSWWQRWDLILTGAFFCSKYCSAYGSTEKDVSVTLDHKQDQEKRAASQMYK